MSYLLSRLKEPSTWAGFGVFVPSIVAVLAGQHDAQSLGTLLMGLIAVFIPEAKKS